MTQRIVDLSLTLTQGTRGVSMESHTRIAERGYNTTTLHLYSHAGTHMDAPLHFVEGGPTIDDVQLERCMGPAEVVDLSYVGPDAFITVDDLLPFELRITPGCRLLLRTDWDRQLGQEAYRNDMPRISAELAHWLVARQVILLGLETPSVASLRPDRRDELLEVHQILLRAGIVIVESLTNLRDLRQDRVTFIALPLKIQGCDGSPVRAVAVEELP